MPTIVKKIAKWSLITAATLAAALTVTVVAMERRTYDAPLPRLFASRDPAVIARGRYLVHGPAHCTECHTNPAQKAALEAGQDVPLAGGVEFKLPLGVIRSANLTADVATGLGGYRDGEIARSLRYGVGHDGRVLAPFMPFADLSDEDLTAVISYLRTQPAVRNPVVRHSLNPLGHTVVALVIRPQGPSMPVRAQVPAGPTVEYGRYLVESVANCAGCHTKRDLRTGAFVGEPLAGGFEFRERAGLFVSPNLTPEPTTGRIASWTEEVFLARFRMAKGAEGSPMPWRSFGAMSDDDLRAVFRYLRTVKPVHNNTGDSVRAVVASR